MEGDLGDEEYREQKAQTTAELDALPQDQGNPDEAVGREEQRVREMRRDDVEDGAPPWARIDLDGGVAYLDPR